jgi:anti-sigma B factor antagonist
MDLEIRVRLTPPLAELTLKGEVDFSNTQRVDSAVDLAASAWGSSLVAVDLQDVTFIDCAGIRTLVQARHRLDAACSYLWITGLSPQVSRMMQLTGTDSLFGVADLVPQAG